MARPESVALGGYYPTPTNLLPHIARLVNVRPAKTVRPRGSSLGQYTFVDPCAGDGDAILGLIRHWFGNGPVQRLSTREHPGVNVLAAELEKERAEALSANVRRTLDYASASNALHSDAFTVSWKEAGAQVLYLNPPYDHDIEYGRLELRFLERFTRILADRGILLLVIPGYVLEACADHLASHYSDMACYRFPDPEYDVFKQVVLVARRDYGRHSIDPTGAARLASWAGAGAAIPTLDEVAGPAVDIPIADSRSAMDWSAEKVDIEGLYQNYRPLMYGKSGALKPVYGMGLQQPVTDIIGATFPVVTKLRPAHVVLALASGLLNGREVNPDNPASDLPPIMLKGVFEKEHHTVDEKKDRDGGTKAVIQVEQPKLQTTVLDMRTWTYHDLLDGAAATGATAFDEMTIADVLHHYGMNMAKKMDEQCPVLHQPGDLVQLPPMALNPYHAQHEAISAALKVLFAGRPPYGGENPFVLGEVGTGKTMVALSVAEALSPTFFDFTRRQMAERGISGGQARPVRNMLVMCPPHLVESWREQTAKFLPGARFVELRRISDVVQALSSSPHRGSGPGAELTVYGMSREMAKLGHSWSPGTDDKNRCPVCGTRQSVVRADLARKRVVCEHQDEEPANDWARLLVEFSALLSPTSRSETPRRYLNGRVLRRYAARQARRFDAVACEAPGTGADDPLRNELYRRRLCPADRPMGESFLGRLASRIYREALSALKDERMDDARDWTGLLVVAFFAIDHPDRDAAVIKIVHKLWSNTLGQHAMSYGAPATVRSNLLELLLTVKDTSCQQQMACMTTLQGMRDGRINVSSQYDFGDLQRDLKRMRYERAGQEPPELPGRHTSYTAMRAHDGTLSHRPTYESGVITLGTPAAGDALFEKLVGLTDFRQGRPCGTPLYSAEPNPRRYPLADYIRDHGKSLFDILVLDEAHEYSTDGSAQERAAHRLVEMGKPVLILTGTSNNGYASSLFMNMWAMSRRFRTEFDRGTQAEFVTRYGYRKVKVEPEKGEYLPKDFGQVTDRVDTGVSTKMRVIGEAPGVMPLFILKHLLPIAISIHKADLDVDLPPMREIRVELSPHEKVKEQYEAMRKKLMEQIMDDLRSGNDELMGKLWGALAQIPTYLDRAHDDTGNTDASYRRQYQIRYPASVGGKLVTEAQPLPANELVSKETWLLDVIRRELAERRPVAVFVWNTNSGLLERIGRLVGDAIGKSKVAVLDATKVPASKRQDWIDRHVLRKRAQVLVVNPKAVETGLNNLVYFPTAVWFQNPNCSSIIYSQANGRFHRPGQEHDEVRIYFPMYEKTTQEVQLLLLGHKVKASKQTDGLDITSALAAAGASATDAIDSMSVGKAIYAMLTDQMQLRHSIGSTVERVNGNGHMPKRPAPAVPVREERPMEPKPVGRATQMRLLEPAVEYWVNSGD